MACRVPLPWPVESDREAAMRRKLQEGQTQVAEILTKSRGVALATFLLLTAASAQAQSSRAISPQPATNAALEPHRRIVVSIPDRKLALLENNRVVKIYRVAVGAPESPSPAGDFRIAQRITEPTYYAPGVVIPAGPENPLGPRWIGLDLKS